MIPWPRLAFLSKGSWPRPCFFRRIARHHWSLNWLKAKTPTNLRSDASFALVPQATGLLRLCRWWSKGPRERCRSKLLSQFWDEKVKQPRAREIYIYIFVLCVCVFHVFHVLSRTCFIHYEPTRDFTDILQIHTYTSVYCCNRCFIWCSAAKTRHTTRLRHNNKTIRNTIRSRTSLLSWSRCCTLSQGSLASKWDSQLAQQGSCHGLPASHCASPRPNRC